MAGGMLDILDSCFTSASIIQVTWKTDWDTGDPVVVGFLETANMV